jgi:hypothetical protein
VVRAATMPDVIGRRCEIGRERLCAGWASTSELTTWAEEKAGQCPGTTLPPLSRMLW